MLCNINVHLMLSFNFIILFSFYIYYHI